MTLTFRLDFPYPDDTCYIAMSYPYTHTSVREHIECLLTKPDAAEKMHRFVLAKTIAGNECDAIVIPARDHGPILALVEGLGSIAAHPTLCACCLHPMHPPPAPHACDPHSTHRLTYLLCVFSVV